MVRTQIYLSDAQQTALARMAQGRHSTNSALIREALDLFLSQEQPADRKRRRMRGFGQWANDKQRVKLAQLRGEERKF